MFFDKDGKQCDTCDFCGDRYYVSSDCDHACRFCTTDLQGLDILDRSMQEMLLMSVLTGEHESLISEIDDLLNRKNNKSKLMRWRNKRKESGYEKLS